MKIDVELNRYGYRLTLHHSPKHENRYRRDSSFYLSAQQVENYFGPAANPYVAHFDDGNHQVIYNFGRLALVEVGELPGLDGVHSPTVVVCHINAPKFFSTLRSLRAKFPPGENTRQVFTFHSERFPEPDRTAPLLTFSEMTRHENGRELTHSLVRFLRSLTPSYVDRLRRELSYYLTRAKVFGCREGDEFYFDGRRFPGGCGFNGGFILRDNQYSIHT